MEITEFYPNHESLIHKGPRTCNQGHQAMHYYDHNTVVAISDLYKIIVQILPQSHVPHGTLNIHIFL